MREFWCLNDYKIFSVKYIDGIINGWDGAKVLKIENNLIRIQGLSPETVILSQFFEITLSGDSFSHMGYIRLTTYPPKQWVCQSNEILPERVNFHLFLANVTEKNKLWRRWYPEF